MQVGSLGFGTIKVPVQIYFAPMLTAPNRQPLQIGHLLNFSQPRTQKHYVLDFSNVDRVIARSPGPDGALVAEDEDDDDEDLAAEDDDEDMTGEGDDDDDDAAAPRTAGSSSSSSSSSSGAGAIVGLG